MKRVGAFLAGLLVLLSIVASPAVTVASWTDQGYTTASVTAGTVGPPVGLGCTAGSGVGGTIGLGWSAPSTGTVTPTSYRIDWSGPAGSGSTTVSTLSGGIDASPLVSGNATVTVTALYGTWGSAPSSSVTLSIFRFGFVFWSCG